MTAYGGIDLHGNNMVAGVMDERYRVLMKERMPLDLGHLLGRLEPYRGILAGIAVESTYNWYWLVDGLMEAGYEVRLVNTAAVPQYEGLKHRDDGDDACWLAKLQHLGLLPTGWICPKERRAVRDLLRKRGQLVRQRTANVLSMQSQYARLLGWRIGGEEARRMPPEAVLEHFDDELSALSAMACHAVVQRLEQQIRMLERVLEGRLEEDVNFRVLRSMPGVGRILGMTIALETGDVGRFKTVGDYASYCRCVQSRRMSNGRRKGEGNRKNGNKYLSWAWREAACFACQNHEPARRWHRRKAARVHPMAAWNALAHKLCRAGWHMMKNRTPFSSALLFG